MNLAQLKGSYNAIFSLGDHCTPSIQLEKNNLRPYSGVLDWLISLNLSDVNRLLQNRFAGFMELPHLKILGIAYEKNLLVWDENYNISSNHDFFTYKNSLQELTAYPEVKLKYDRRIDRFLEKTATAHRMLFIRCGDFTDEQVEELLSTLSELFTHDFCVLLVKHTPVTTIVEANCKFNKVCTIELPMHDYLNGNDHLWKHVLDGIHIV
ncbi:DUF1796 family putative cysteine peptidase [Paenibacillus alginolyticus]|uniref:Papain-like cysteine peptidase n=1 Tax=Paenibacillus alginolyticus TaxID=59839 RepID=A0ABT4GDY3_9BACL|nr:DUF1796 family putative cysteine peptidase [Paenibacillus alginolyticus]MCY9694371.1 papain-like cysteine peptidase [Paenibacillus alginolyticus]MEC0147540.1 DUF1796 family putative cysteine peptidase [Paenibacillus alginolyticus]